MPLVLRLVMCRDLVIDVTSEMDVKPRISCPLLHSNDVSRTHYSLESQARERISNRMPRTTGMVFKVPTVAHTAEGETVDNTRSAGLRGAGAVCVIGWAQGG